MLLLQAPLCTHFDTVPVYKGFVFGIIYPLGRLLLYLQRANQGKNNTKLDQVNCAIVKYLDYEYI